VQWLAGQEDMVQAYRDDMDAYNVMAARMYKLRYEDLNKESPERVAGKMAVLLCGYQGGPDKFKSACWTQHKVAFTLEESEDIVDGYRSTCPAVVRGWKDMNRAALSATVNSAFLDPKSREAIARTNYEPTEQEALGGKVRFETDTAGIEALYMVLPSGHRLCYPRPRLSVKINTRKPCRECRGWMAEHSVTDVLKLRKAQENGDVECKCQKPFSSLCIVYKKAAEGQVLEDSTYGGKLFENLCQAVAGDCLNHAILNASKAGYEPVMLIHDEAIYPKQPGQSTEELVQIFELVPPWAKGFPLAADAKEIPYYLK
jgi:DNA polymerase